MSVEFPTPVVVLFTLSIRNVGLERFHQLLTLSWGHMPFCESDDSQEFLSLTFV